jgi:hypothetical protein
VTGVVGVEGIIPGFSYSLVSVFSLIFFVSQVWVGDGGPVCW